MSSTDVEVFQSIVRAGSASQRPPRAGSAQLSPAVPLIVRDIAVASDATAKPTTITAPSATTTERHTTTATPRPKVILPPAIRLSQDQFKSLQKWEGIVTQLGRETFWARLVDLTAPGSDDEEIGRAHV